MKKVFWEDPYLRTLHTKVNQVADNEVVFDATIGYSECGGQESDRLIVNGMEVLSSRMDKVPPFFIYYTLPKGHNMKPGDEVTMAIDWTRRYRLMRLHFACELVLVLMNRLFNRTPDGVELKPDEIDTVIRKRGAHIGEEGARVDFECSENIAQYFPVLMKGFERIVTADLPIETGYLDEKLQKRYWRLPDLATVPCGGTHVRSTGEVEKIVLKRDRANKGVERIRIHLEA